MRLVLFQPDIPQNLGGAIRLAACFGAPLDVIGPCGFPLTDRAVRRAALDYGDLAQVRRHDGWDAFLTSPERRSGRLILFTTAAETGLWDLALAADDLLMFGRESAGAPAEAHAAADLRARIPLAPGARSLNVVAAAAIA
ncbi:MAG: tRNA (cytidine(34)-2'-O)-methyltransferase, partial [Caulobacterales bacterium]|nr:tRNA (cytidine(34)-2'-O)-methyltransferase [Caulobacterales bacterium]